MTFSWSELQNSSGELIYALIQRHDERAAELVCKAVDFVKSSRLQELLDNMLFITKHQCGNQLFYCKQDDGTYHEHVSNIITENKVRGKISLIKLIRFMYSEYSLIQAKIIAETCTPYIEHHLDTFNPLPEKLKCKVICFEIDCEKEALPQPTPSGASYCKEHHDELFPSNEGN